ncbi:GNAT family N-acetyltransferase [Ochrobactrum sp. MR28]|nr:GNAT family N-acetyltransferase [Ochrobactrum sp. MR28]MBX8817949.1 GNAT family N-acetyltransferase [Ochrobactrum sp. MR31]
MAETEKSELSFRLAVREDCAAILAALKLLAQSIGVSERCESTLQDLEIHGFGDKPQFTVMLAETDGKMAGMCLYFPMFSTWLGKPGLYIQDIYVHEAYRNAKIGEKLLRHVSCIGREEGYAYLRLTVDEGNEGGARFYSNHGFIRSDDEYIYKLIGPAFDAFCDA